MGKAKKRSFQLGIYNQVSRLSRENAVKEVIKILKTPEGTKDSYELITLFGMSAEELLEAGADYETVISLRGIIKE